jgi:hypothetical protein
MAVAPLRRRAGMNEIKNKERKMKEELKQQAENQKPEEPNTRPLRRGERKIIANKNYVTTLNKKVEAIDKWKDDRIELLHRVEKDLQQVRLNTEMICDCLNITYKK